MSIPKKKDFIKISDCGRYGLLSNSELWRIAGKDSYMAGHVMDPERLDYAVEVAEEEMACLLDEVREEFGF